MSGRRSVRREDPRCSSAALGLSATAGLASGHWEVWMKLKGQVMALPGGQSSEQDHARKPRLRTRSPREKGSTAKSQGPPTEVRRKGKAKGTQKRNKDSARTMTEIPKGRVWKGQVMQQVLEM